MSSFIRLLIIGLIGLGLFNSAPAFADMAIGQVLTLSGPDAQAGQEMAAGARAYIDKLNAEGGVDGQKIIYLTGDDAGQPGQTVVRASELMARADVFGMLAGSQAQIEAVVSSGALRQNTVPMVSITDALPPPAATRAARLAGLVEVVPAGNYAEHLQREFAAALAKYGRGDVQPTPLALQGYTAAKVLTGAMLLMSANPTRAEFFRTLQILPPNIGSRLVTIGYQPE